MNAIDRVQTNKFTFRFSQIIINNFHKSFSFSHHNIFDTPRQLIYNRPEYIGGGGKGTYSSGGGAGSGMQGRVVIRYLDAV